MIATAAVHLNQDARKSSNHESSEIIATVVADTVNVFFLFFIYCFKQYNLIPF